MTPYSSAATQSPQQRHCFVGRAVAATVSGMAKDERRAKVTPETKAESARLKKLWDDKAHPSQAEFGELYGIGNQSAVGQFLRGDTPLSLKAARGFALGLSCRIEDFSPRLAAEAAVIAKMVPLDHLEPEVATVATAIAQLPKRQRDWVLKTLQDVIEMARETIPLTAESARKKTDPSEEESFGKPSRRMKGGR